MTLQECIRKELKDLNLYFYGVQLNVTDNGSLQELAKQMISQVEGDQPFANDFAKIYPVALLVNMAALNQTLENLKNGTLSELDKQTIVSAINLLKDNPAFVETCLKEVDALRAEPTTD